jgi:hypothetical protein
MAQKIKVAESKTTILGQTGRVYVTLPTVGRVFIPKELGIHDGEILSGYAEVVEKTYNVDAAGKPVEPWKRMELESYTSFKAMKAMLNEELDMAVIERKVAALPTIELTEKSFSFVS